MLTRAALALADASVALAYSAPGYHLRRRTWEDPDIAVDLSGRRLLVTGATRGLGAAAARALAQRGADLVLVGRDEGAGEAVAAQCGGEFVACDLGSMAQTAALAERLKERPLHGMLLNAGVLLPERRVTQEGLEASFAINVLSGFLLCRELGGHLAGGRVVHVSSGGMYAERLGSDLQWSSSGPWDGVRQYARTKRMQVVLSELWAQRWSDVASHCMHPGWADTPGVQTSLPTFRRLTRPLLRDAEQGADTAVWLMAKDHLPSGRFWLDRVARPTHYTARTREEPEQREALWAACEQLLQEALAA